jgi:hypothetical protein
MSVVDWQTRLDKLFPDGCMVCIYSTMTQEADGDLDDWTPQYVYECPRPYCVAVVNGNPQIVVWSLNPESNPTPYIVNADLPLVIAPEANLLTVESSPGGKTVLTSRIPEDDKETLMRGKDYRTLAMVSASIGTSLGNPAS